MPPPITLTIWRVPVGYTPYRCELMWAANRAPTLLGTEYQAELVEATCNKR